MLSLNFYVAFPCPCIHSRIHPNFLCFEGQNARKFLNFLVGVLLGISGAKSHYRSQVGPIRGPNACLWALGSLCKVENRVSTQKLPYLKGQNAGKFSNFPFWPYSDISDAKSEFLGGFSMSMHPFANPSKFPLFWRIKRSQIFELSRWSAFGHFGR